MARKIAKLSSMAESGSMDAPKFMLEGDPPAGDRIPHAR
jgi:hypothetical protein